jgi:hypothetical protein
LHNTSARPASVTRHGVEQCRGPPSLQTTMLLTGPSSVIDRCRLLPLLHTPPDNCQAALHALHEYSAMQHA